MLVTTIDQVRKEIGSAIRKEQTMEILAPYIENAEEKLIADLIGSGQLAALNNSDVDTVAKLKKLTIRAIVWNGYQQAWHQGFYQFGTTGVNRSSTKENEALFRYQEDQIKEDVVRKADESVEDLMLFLETNIDNYPLYKESANFARNFAYLISTPGALHQSLPEVSKSHRMYMVLRGYMNRVELTTAMAVMGADLFDDLKTKIASADVLDPHYKRLLSLAQDLVAPATLLEAMPWISVQFSPTGIRIMKVFNNLKDENPLNDTQNAGLLENLRIRIKEAKVALRTFLNSVASSTIFPDYFNSALYQAPGSNPWKMPNNEGKKHFRL